uniref:Uncharacterized protein n=1 Tax=Pinctada fucata TaxID=50426 RepID=A0A194AKJ5_PINFU
MKFLGVFLIAYLLCGVQCNFFDDLKHAASSVGHSIGQAASAVGDQVKHYGGQALQSALDTLTTDGVHQLVSAGLSAAGTAALTALVGKREMSKVDQAVTILKQDAATLEKVLHGYSADLQHVYNNIHNMEFLRHDPQKFLADIGVLKSRYESVLDNLAKNFQAKMSQLQSHDKRRGLLDGLASAFQKTVDLSSRHSVELQARCRVAETIS